MMQTFSVHVVAPDDHDDAFTWQGRIGFDDHLCNTAVLVGRVRSYSLPAYCHLRGLSSSLGAAGAGEDAWPSVRSV
jgi:hypothetical protein